jgi:hypothetical protein
LLPAASLLRRVISAFTGPRTGLFAATGSPPTRRHVARIGTPSRAL